MPTVADDNSIRTTTRMRASGPHPFASPHTVRRTLADPRQSSALFGGLSRCARSDCQHLTAHIMKRRQIPFPQMGRSHNPLVAGSSPARPTSELRDPDRASSAKCSRSAAQHCDGLGRPRLRFDGRLRATSFASTSSPIHDWFAARGADGCQARMATTRVLASWTRIGPRVLIRTRWMK